MRPIDGDKLMMHLTDWWYSSFGQAETDESKAIKTVIDKIEKTLGEFALEKQEQDRWIPCSVRLPEKDGEYLVTFESGYAEDYGFDPIGIAPFEVDCEGFGIWQERFHPVSLGSLGSDWVDIPVTAWRPLPEAYEAEEKE